MCRKVPLLAACNNAQMLQVSSQDGWLESLADKLKSLTGRRVEFDLGLVQMDTCLATCVITTDSLSV